MHIIAAKAICFGEALKPEFTDYMKQVLANAKALSQRLIENGFNIVSGGTDNHLMLVDLRPMNITGKDLEHKLDEVRITCNKNAIPFDTQKPFVTSGIRIGTAATTTRGFVEEDMIEIGKLIGPTLKVLDNSKDEVMARVKALCEKHPLYE